MSQLPCSIFLKMKILAIDQSRCGGYAIFDNETKKLISYGAFNFPDRKYTYPMAIHKLKKLVQSLVKENDIGACFIEEISFQRNLNGFKRLAQMQGVLENFFLENNMLYGMIQPTMWQKYANARKRTRKEIKNKIVKANIVGKKETKVLSIQFAHDVYRVDTPNDGIADAIGIGHYAIHHIKFEMKEAN